MAFVYDQKIKFRHCDPAGIVFYPRYFEMINDTVETFFDRETPVPFAAMHPANGIPTAQIATQFTAPSRLGDQLAIALHLTKLGRTSAGLSFAATCGGQGRFTATSTLVWIDDTGRPTPWPDPLRAALAEHLEGDNDAP